MGSYVNPESETKESFLEREGMVVDNPSWKDKPKNTLPVVLVSNAFFTAAGIAYCEKELKVFLDPFDFRPKTFYYVNIDKLAGVSDILEWYRE